MKILCLEPFYGGSHKAFLDSWTKRSCHEWSTFGLPPFKWKWRMRHAPITLAQDMEKEIAKGKKWDLLFCSDMLNLAEFKGLVPEPIRKLPSIVYFHENQLTYPNRVGDDRDLHFSLSNLTTCLAADEVWWNSKHNRESFLETLHPFLNRMPDYNHLETIEIIKNKSKIFPQGIEEIPLKKERESGPMRILWAHRWEHDKNPEDFFQALTILKKKNIEFKVSVIGEEFKESPPVFEKSKTIFQDEILYWGFQQTREDYLKVLSQSDVFISTANHEFFGVSVVEAISTGLYPVLPKRLAYPELLGDEEVKRDNGFYYNSTPQQLARLLQTLAHRLSNKNLWEGNPQRAIVHVEKFKWENLYPVLDKALKK